MPDGAPYPLAVALDKAELQESVTEALAAVTVQSVRYGIW